MNFSSLYKASLVFLLVGLAASADVIETKDGARLVGTVKGINEGKITLNTTYAGDISIDQAEVVSLTMEDALAIRLDDGTTLEGTVNAEAMAGLPPDLQSIVRVACKAANMDMFADFEARNGEALQTLVNEHKVELRPFPDEVLAELKRVSFEVFEEQAANDEMSAKVWTSLKAFMEQVKPSTKIGSQHFVNRR